MIQETAQVLQPLTSHQSALVLIAFSEGDLGKTEMKNIMDNPLYVDKLKDYRSRNISKATTPRIAPFSHITRCHQMSCRWISWTLTRHCTLLFHKIGQWLRFSSFCHVIDRSPRPTIQVPLASENGPHQQA